MREYLAREPLSGVKGMEVLAALALTLATGELFCLQGNFVFQCTASLFLISFKTSSKPAGFWGFEWKTLSLFLWKA